MTFDIQPLYGVCQTCHICHIGQGGEVRLSVDSTTFSQIFYNLQEDAKSTIGANVVRALHVMRARVYIVATKLGFLLSSMHILFYVQI